jgi:hypothetical protein
VIQANNGKECKFLFANVDKQGMSRRRKLYYSTRRKSTPEASLALAAEALA